VLALLAAFQLDDARRELDVGVDQREQGIEVVPVERIVRSMGQLAVLLRPRPQYLALA
jgi:hypothetical protein